VLRTIEDIEARLEEDLSKLRGPEYKAISTLRERLTPPGYRAHVQLLAKGGRKKRKDASADSWSPESGEIRISFEPEVKWSPPAKSMRATGSPSDPVSDLVRSLDRAELTPGYDFVSLKWFRDVVLKAESFDWAQSDAARQAVLRESIERRLVLTSKVQNPKSPQFPVTAIRLNRLLPATQAILGEASAIDSDFDPVEIRGEGLSATVLRQRR
jgi:hypothetical protein